MARYEMSYRCVVSPGTQGIIAPGGIATPHATCIGVAVDGGEAVAVQEAHTGQFAYNIKPQADTLKITYSLDDEIRSDYPNAAFRPVSSRFTRFASDLVDEARGVAGSHKGVDRARAIAFAAAERFTYGHPNTRFYEGHDTIPALGCGLSEGSCVDINTYFVAALRAAEIYAAYVSGFFFPAEKGDHCSDGHCWVVTRIDGATQEWDIAHHLKSGTRDIRPSLNPKPGFRVACFHSMGLDFPALGIRELKALIEPMALTDAGPTYFDSPEIRLRHPAIRPAQAAASNEVAQNLA